ncbi:MAG: HAD family hydrolase [Lachnospiraceae bacterium]|nr:HAD family hydrolase [Lachnospiraceae bacterium]
MITALLFDIGGTLHTVENSPALRVRFAERLLTRLSLYGIHLNTDPQALAASLHENAEFYKHESEKTLRELPCPRIWNEYYLREFGLGEKVLAPIAEELSFLFDYERVVNLRRPRLRETMEELHEMGLHLGIISNIISTSFVPHILKEYGIDPLMECVVMSSTCGIRKPDAAIFKIAMEHLAVAPEETAYVGDTLSRDVLGSRNAGLALAIRIGNPAAAHRDSGLSPEGILKPDYQIRELYEIPDIIREYNRTHT